MFSDGDSRPAADSGSPLSRRSAHRNPQTEGPWYPRGLPRARGHRGRWTDGALWTAVCESPYRAPIGRKLQLVSHPVPSVQGWR
jgi:hypothetical protein